MVVARRGSAMEFRLSRPERANSYTQEMLAFLEEQIEQADESGDTMSRRTVEILNAVNIEQGGALSAYDHQGLFGISPRGMFCFDFDDIFCVHCITVPFPEYAFEIGF